MGIPKAKSWDIIRPGSSSLLEKTKEGVSMSSVRRKGGGGRCDGLGFDVQRKP